MRTLLAPNYATRPSVHALDSDVLVTMLLTGEEKSLLK